VIRILIYALTLLHLGPGIAFALLAFGCEGSRGVLGDLCFKDAFATFALLTGGAWAILLAGWAAVHSIQRARCAPQPSPRLRARALGAVLCAAALVCAAGVGLTASQLWFLAIPGGVALAWLFVANPVECKARMSRREEPARRECAPETAPVPRDSIQDSTTS
jgi:hypothetical protein